MPIGSFFALLDDITLQSKVAISKASGVVADDLALNSNMVTGIPRERELPVVRAIALASLANKIALSAGALAISAFAPSWVIPALLMLGGAYLCYEGAEKIRHALGPKHERHGGEDEEAQAQAPAPAPAMDDAAYRHHEKTVIRSATITDVVLSAEITALTLGGLDTASPLASQAGVLLATGLGMTVGVYGLVACIVKIDDGAVIMMGRDGDGSVDRFVRAVGGVTLRAVPYLMAGLGYVGTAAMFVVGGGIFAHHVPGVHHMVEAVVHEGMMEHIVPLAADTLCGLIAGAASLVAVDGLLFAWKRIGR